MHWAQDELSQLGYRIDSVAPVGADFLAIHQGEKYAVRAQLNGSPDLSSLFELEGARRFHDCTQALVLHTSQLPDEVASAGLKLGIKLQQLNLSGERLWPWLAQQRGELSEELLRRIMQGLYTGQSLTREDINQMAGTRASNQIISLLTQLPQVEFAGYPASLRLRAPHTAEQINLPELGYQGFQTFQELLQDMSEIPQQAGTYVVEWVGGEPDFLARGSGGHSKGDPNVPVSQLRAQWVPEATVLYVAKAGVSGTKATLRSRVKQLLEFGQGKPAKHYGGRYLWQLRQAPQLRLAWKIGEPDQLEQELLSQFMTYHGRLPYANLQE